jgi:membrane protease YdiL (CAAX protease family)
MVGRSLDLEEAYRAAPAWERLLFDLTMSDSGDTLDQAITWYAELAAATPDPLAQVQLAVLEAEAGRLDAVRRKIGEWAHETDSLPFFSQLVQAAYFAPKLDRSRETRLQAELAEQMPAGWFYDHLAINLAVRAGDRGLQAATRAAQESRAQPLLERARLLAIVQLLGMLAGFVVLGWVIRHRHDRRVFQVGTAPVPPLWQGRVGVVVLIRGGALSMLMTLALLSYEEDLLLRSLVIPLVNLPILLLARKHLFRPTGTGFVQALGLKPLTGWRPLAMTTVTVLVAGLLGEWVLGQAAAWLDLASHWTEWFDGELVWGSPLILAVSLGEYVLLAPLFEELIFRGLLFATFRRRFSLWFSALLSAGIFAAAHGYGLLGTVSVLWSGLLWAWIYEKSGSLLPAMIAHLLNNLFVCLTIIALLRL